MHTHKLTSLLWRLLWNSMPPSGRGTKSDLVVSGPLKGFGMAKAKHAGTVPVEHITQSILVFRGHKVLLDEDLATLYAVTTGALVQAVKRNIGRFPEDFMFQLTATEWAVLRSRIVIPTSRHGGRRFAQLETRLDKKLTEHDEAIAAILSAIRQLMGKSSTH
jgi:hypothetical protein